MHDAPWLDQYQNVPHTLDYPDCAMVDLLLRAAERWPQQTAYSFFDKQTDYQTFAAQIKQCAAAFCALGIAPGQRVTVCLPNVPQAIIAFYALNYMGAVANMIHPLSSEGEIAFFLEQSDSVAAITLDAFLPRFLATERGRSVPHLIVTGIGDALSGLKKIGFALTKGRKIPPVPVRENICKWGAFLAAARTDSDCHCSRSGEDAAVILYSGGTTGTTKGILLTNKNFNALGLQTAAAGDCIVPGNKMLAIMPIFHGFGLGVCIHTVLIAGCQCILVPQFNVATYAKLLRTCRPNYIACKGSFAAVTAYRSSSNARSTPFCATMVRRCRCARATARPSASPRAA